MTLPCMADLPSGSVGVDRIRRVQIQDLLRREPITIDVAGVRGLLRDSGVLVTGAGGSIGSELCRQIARCAPAALVLLSHGENSLYRIGNELRSMYPDLLVPAVVADVRNWSRLETIFATHRPKVVFHAAAHKHVPFMEDNVADALSNNVGGTRNLAEVSAAFGAERLVMISTDKAVNPTSVMGATKRLAELVV